MKMKLDRAIMLQQREKEQCEVAKGEVAVLVEQIDEVTALLYLLYANYKSRRSDITHGGSGDMFNDDETDDEIEGLA
eukprot:CAMPEP_0173411040 /NCGR_PEP_ID=MMETSP1356-20130122/76015_1 /TAXON_ID=77927 ORGANISM="Hemiselmis virescens, Strain PCC157" /NCGR_SAMPLE_ID=MMETSP1356 /ASSEMBLY_ACC=CAM_ASM_000847 /LENGTH=76 /DNA_ID=CAMNT_0014372739 /DNA_START=35 /DNA_END=262 /DNA_ORIENTATION=+